MNTNDRYTNLIPIYIYKTIVFAGVACWVLLQSTTIETLLTGAITYLVGILFDILIVAKTNSGPKLRMRNFLLYFLHYLLMAFIVAMLVCSFARAYIDAKAQGIITAFVYIIVIGYTLTGALLEIITNIPRND